MKLIFNTNKTLVENIRKLTIKNGGYCPCRLKKTDDNYCMCKEFREQLADPNFEGFCHCNLYQKIK